MTPNKGYCPAEAKGKRVVVLLRDGSICGREPVGNSLPAGWAADGRQGCRWSVTGSRFDIAEYEVLS